MSMFKRMHWQKPGSAGSPLLPGFSPLLSSIARWFESDP